MSYPKKILKFRPSKGLVNDLPAAEVAPDFWTNGANVHFRDGFGLRTQGHAQVYTGLQSTLRGIQNVVAGGTNYWLYYGTNKIYAVETTNHTDITPSGISTVTDVNQWTLSLLNGIPIACNGVDAPYYWDLSTGSDFAELPNWPSGYVAGGVRAHRYNLFAFDVTTGSGDFPMQVLWSNSALPGAIPQAWTAAATNDAGDNSLSETPGKIVDALGLRSSLVLYKQHSCYAADYVKGNNVYEFRKLFVTAGTLGKNCAVDVNGVHYILADGDVLATDGSTAQSLIDKRMRNWLFNQIDQSNFHAAFVISYPSANEVWVCFPTSGNTFCDAALIIDTDTGNALGVRDLPAISCAATGIINDNAESQFYDDQAYTFDSAHFLFNQQTYTEAADALVLGAPNDGTPTSSKLFQVDSGSDFGGTAIAANLARHYLDFDEPNRVKLIRRLIPHVVATDGVAIICKVGSSMTSTGSITWQSEQTFTVGTTEYLDFLVQGKFISVEMRSSGGEPWTIPGFDLEGELRGYY